MSYEFNMVDMGGIDLATANGTVVDGLYNKLLEGIDACGNLILYNWKFAEIEIVPSSCTTLKENSSIVINGLIEVTEQDEVTVLGIAPPPVPVEPLFVESNGIYTAVSPVSGFNPVSVNVPIPRPRLIPISIVANGDYTPPSGVDGFNRVTVAVPAAGNTEITVAVQNDALVADGCEIVSQPVIIDGKMCATSSQGLEILPNYRSNVCLEVDYKYVEGPSIIVFSFGGSNNSSGGVISISNSVFAYYASGDKIYRADLNINFDQERHIKIIATASNALYFIVDDVVILNVSHSDVHNILDYCLSQKNIALGWNQSWHSEYNSGTFNNMKISFDSELPNT